MKQFTIYLRVILILAELSGYAVAETKNQSGSPDDMPRLRLEAQQFKDDYRTEYLKDTEDYPIFENLGRAARSSPELIDSLIDLCDIKETPTTTEKYSPASLTPASRMLKRLGPLARPKVESALVGGNLTLWQRAVLEEVLYHLALVEAGSKGLPRPREYNARKLQWSDFDHVPAQETGTLLTNERELLWWQPPFQPKSPSEITAPEPQPAVPPQAQPPLQTQPISQQPVPVAAASSASRFGWGVAAAVAATVLAVSVAWIGIKKRK